MPVTVSTSQGPPAEAWTSIMENDASGNQLYVGQARSFQEKPAPLTVSSVSKANPAVVAVTGHGLQSDNTVDVAGGTGDWAGINGNQKITVIDANSFSIPVNTSAYAGTFAGAVTTNSPQTNAGVWSIQKFYYDSNGFQNRVSLAGGSPAPRNSWASRATLKYL